MNVKDALVDDIIEETKKAIFSACRMLSIREHSHSQMNIKLAKKGFSQLAISKTIDYLVDENWISEARFCESFIYSKSKKGQGLNRIVFELKKHGIEQSMINQSLLEEPIDWLSLCINTLKKKIRISPQNGHENKTVQKGVKDSELICDIQDSVFELKRQQRVKLENFLSYRGFNHEEIRIAIKKCNI